MSNHTGRSRTAPRRRSAHCRSRRRWKTRLRPETVLSRDGKAARMIITHDTDPATPQGISHIDAIQHAAEEAVKRTP